MLVSIARGRSVRACLRKCGVAPHGLQAGSGLLAAVIVWVGMLMTGVLVRMVVIVRMVMIMIMVIVLSMVVGVIVQGMRHERIGLIGLQELSRRHLLLRRLGL